ncbi:hypothetical protein JCM5350_000944 [Sporobolomyces pararoseus]
MTSGSSSNILILQRDSKRIAVALPPTLELALSAASHHFPSLLRPLHLTRNLPDFVGDVEVTESVWQTSWIQGHQFLTLDVHESEFQVQEEEVKPKKRIKLEEPEQKPEKVSTQVGSNRGSKEAKRSLSPLVQQEVNLSNPLSNPDLPQTSETPLPSPPASRGGHTLSPPVESTLVPSVVPPEMVHVKVIFMGSSKLPDMYFNVQRSVKMVKILSKVADLYAADRSSCHYELRLVCDRIRLRSETAGELFEYDDFPVIVEVWAEALGGGT